MFYKMKGKNRFWELYPTYSSIESSNKFLGIGVTKIGIRRVKLVVHFITSRNPNVQIDWHNIFKNKCFKMKLFRLISILEVVVDYLCI